eukprot:g24097.t1
MISISSGSCDILRGCNRKVVDASSTDACARGQKQWARWRGRPSLLSWITPAAPAEAWERRALPESELELASAPKHVPKR